jgi:hypothetical protein
MLDPPEALLFESDDKLTVPQEHRRAVGVIGVDSEDVHRC